MTTQHKSAYGRIDLDNMPPKHVMLRLRMKAIGDWNREQHTTQVPRERFIDDRHWSYIADFQEQQRVDERPLKYGVNV
jgi:hypothetical protein